MVRWGVGPAPGRKMCRFVLAGWPHANPPPAANWLTLGDDGFGCDCQGRMVYAAHVGDALVYSEQSLSLPLRGCRGAVLIVWVARGGRWCG